jgi:hypothetical protein
MERIVRELETYVLIIHANIAKDPGMRLGLWLYFPCCFAGRLKLCATPANPHSGPATQAPLSGVLHAQKVKLKSVFLNVSTLLLKAFGDFVIVARRSMQIQEITNIDASDARRLISINELIITVAMRRPANKFAGYTLQSPPSGTGCVAKSSYWGVNASEVVRHGRTL